MQARATKRTIAPGAVGVDEASVGLNQSHEYAGFEELVSAYQDQVARLARRLLAWPEDVDDVVQEVFLRVLRNLPRFRGQCRVETWLWRITVNTCRTWQRKRLFRTTLARTMAQGSRSSTSVPEERLGYDEASQVRLAVAALPRRYREVVVLRYLEQLPVKEVAQILGITPTAVSVRLGRAREKLRQRLGRLMENQT